MLFIVDVIDELSRMGRVAADLLGVDKVRHIMNTISFVVIDSIIISMLMIIISYCDYYDDY